MSEEADRLAGLVIGVRLAALERLRELLDHDDPHTALAAADALLSHTARKCSP